MGHHEHIVLNEPKTIALHGIDKTSRQIITPVDRWNTGKRMQAERRWRHRPEVIRFEVIPLLILHPGCLEPRDIKTAIDIQEMTGDIGRFVGGKKGCCCCNLFGLAITFDR